MQFLILILLSQNTPLFEIIIIQGCKSDSLSKENLVVIIQDI